MEVADGGGADEAFDCDGDFVFPTIGGDQAFGGEVNFDFYFFPFQFKGVMGDVSLVFFEAVPDGVMKKVFCAHGSRILPVRSFCIMPYWRFWIVGALLFESGDFRPEVLENLGGEGVLAGREGADPRDRWGGLY